MDRPLTQVIHGLIPIHSGSLPPELVDLAQSLLAQSRAKASSLKAEEEIARSYACANIACERLKHSLSLPKIQPRPPCPPRIYQKLYQYLDEVLTNRTKRTQQLFIRSDATSTPPITPSKPRHPAKSSPFKSATPINRSLQQASGRREAPEWLMHAIRHLCKSLGAPAALNHVFAGVASILALPVSQEAGEEPSRPEKLHVSALVIAIFLLVKTRLSGLQTGASEYQRQVELSALTLEEVSKPADEKNAAKADVDSCLKSIRDRHWTQLDWFTNVPQKTGLGDRDMEVESENASDLEADYEKSQSVHRSMVEHFDEDADYLQPGLGTMMQDKVDYLSERRRQEFLEWKAGIMIRIEEIAKSHEMDVSPG